MTIVRCGAVVRKVLALVCVGRVVGTPDVRRAG